jgi:aminoglycoside phosphotransferase
MYLKIAPKQPMRDLLEEKKVLEWLSEKLPVSKVLCYDEDDNNDYLLTSEIPGSDAVNLIGSINNIKLVTLLAKGLRMIHRIDINNCPFDRLLKKELEIAEFKVKHNLVNEGNFDDIRRGKTAEELYEELLLLKPHDEELVFTHGDYCLPNIILQQEMISGFVDLHRAGIADRYKDISLMIRSIRRNLGIGLEQLFFEEYGVVKPDYKKVEYYMLLDEFF